MALFLKHNPWRAPGSAPVMDACGLAGGSYSREDGPEAGDYVKTEFAQHGDVGTRVLKPVPGHTPPKYKVRLLVNRLRHLSDH